jgi:hypothetical protein
MISVSLPQKQNNCRSFSPSLILKTEAGRLPPAGLFYMRTFADLANAFKKVNVEKAAVNAFFRTEDALVSAVAEQMSKGMTGRDEPIVSPYTGKIYYAPMTVQYKQENGSGIGKITEHITLFQTGNHYRGLYAALRGRNLEIGSTVQYDAAFNRANKELYQPGTQAGQDFINDQLEPAMWDELVTQLNK